MEIVRETSTDWRSQQLVPPEKEMAKGKNLNHPKQKHYTTEAGKGGASAKPRGRQRSNINNTPPEGNLKRIKNKEEL